MVLQAGALARNGSTYVLDSGQPVRIVTLAADSGNATRVRTMLSEAVRFVVAVDRGSSPGGAR